MTAPHGPWGPPEESEQEADNPGPGWLPFVMLIALAGLGLLALNAFLPHVLEKEDNLLRVLFLVALLALVGGGAVSAMRASPLQTLKQAAAWVGIFAAIGVVYIIGKDAGITGSRLLSEIAPSNPVSTAPGDTANAGEATDPATGEQVVTVRRGYDGHFRLRGRVNGQPIEFLVDTGASLVVLSPLDARRSGFHPNQLKFDGVAQTANGIAAIAYVTIPELEVGDFIVRDVPAAVAGEGLTESLLGMSLLERLEGFTVTGETMELRPPRY